MLLVSANVVPFAAGHAGTGAEVGVAALEEAVLTADGVTGADTTDELTAVVVVSAALVWLACVVLWLVCVVASASSVEVVDESSDTVDDAGMVVTEDVADSAVAVAAEVPEA